MRHVFMLCWFISTLSPAHRSYIPGQCCNRVIICGVDKVNIKHCSVKMDVVMLVFVCLCVLDFLLWLSRHGNCDEIISVWV